MDPSIIAALISAAGQSLPPLLEMLTGRSRNIAQQQGRQYNPLDVLLGAPQTREPFMAQQSAMYSDLLSQLGPFAQRLLGGSPSAFSPMYESAMQQFESETAPRIQQQFSGGQEKYTGGFDTAMAQAGRMLQRDLAKDQAERQMSLINTMLGSMAQMRQVGAGQAARPGLLQNLLTPDAIGRSPLGTIAASGINALFPSGPSAEERAARPLGVNIPQEPFTLGSTLPASSLPPRRSYAF